MSTFAHIDELTLDLSAIPGKRSDLTVFAKQEDNTRRVLITLQDNREDYEIPAGVSLLLRALKPDGHFVLADIPYEGNQIYLTFPREMLTCAGCVRAEICLTAGDEILTSATFYVEVIPTALSDTASSNDLTALSRVLSDAVFLTKQALLPVVAETVTAANGFDPSTFSLRGYSNAPTWQEDHYAFEGSGTQYSNAQTAFSAGRRYFAGSDETSYCKLIGSGATCTGYVLYRPLGVSDAATETLRDLLNGETVENRQLPTALQVSKLQSLLENQQINANSTSYHLLEHSLYVYLYAWIQVLDTSLSKGIAIDLGTGKKMRFVTEEELEQLDNRITALGG